MSLKVSLNNLAKQWEDIQSIVEPEILRLLRSGQYASQKDVKQFEDCFKFYTNSSYAIGVSNGTDALKLIYDYIKERHNIKDIILPANTFASDIFSANELVVKLVDCDKYYQIDINLLEEYLKAIQRPSIVCVTHMFGHPSDTEQIKTLCDHYGSWLVEDCSHAHGTQIHSGHVGNLGLASAYSLYPGKTLGAAGEAGVITTNNLFIYDFIDRKKHLGMRQKYHHELVGVNNRMDDIQAIILKHKLTMLDSWIEKRQQVVDYYNQHLNSEFFITPLVASWAKKVSYYCYIVRVKHSRDKLIRWLESQNIQTNIYWPIPIQKMSMYRHLDCGNPNTIDYANHMLALPLHPYLTEEELNYVVTQANSFYEERIDER